MNQWRHFQISFLLKIKMAHNNQQRVITIFYLLVDKLMDQSHPKKLVHHMVLMQTVFSAPPTYESSQL
jgi:hypothetical protein